MNNGAGKMKCDVKSRRERRRLKTLEKIDCHNIKFTSNLETSETNRWEWIKGSLCVSKDQVDNVLSLKKWNKEKTLTSFFIKTFEGSFKELTLSLWGNCGTMCFPELTMTAAERGRVVWVRPSSNWKWESEKGIRTRIDGSWKYFARYSQNETF